MSCTKPLLYRASILGIAVAVLTAGAVATGMGVPRAFASEVSGGVDVQEVASAETQEEDGDPEANLPFLFAVFIITWAVLFAFVFVMSRRQSALQREIEALRSALLAKDNRSVESGEGAEQP
jgi:CcmD family protein